MSKIDGGAITAKTFPREFADVPIGAHAIAGAFVEIPAGAGSDCRTKRSSSLGVEREKGEQRVVEAKINTERTVPIARIENRRRWAIAGDRCA